MCKCKEILEFIKTSANFINTKVAFFSFTQITVKPETVSKAGLMD